MAQPDYIAPDWTCDECGASFADCHCDEPIEHDCESCCGQGLVAPNNGPDTVPCWTCGGSGIQRK